MRRSDFVLKLGILGLLLFYSLPPSLANAGVYHRDTYPYGYKSANYDGIDSLAASASGISFTTPAIKIQDAYYIRIDLTNYVSSGFYTDTLGYFAVAFGKDSVSWSHPYVFSALLGTGSSAVTMVDTLGVVVPKLYANTIVPGIAAAFSTSGGSYPTKSCVMHYSTIPQNANWIKVYMGHGVSRGRAGACAACAAFKYKLVVDVAYLN